MRIALFNVNGLSGKINMCKEFFKNEVLDVFLLVETKLSLSSDHYGSSFLNIRKSNPLANNRGFGTIGGIMGWASERLDGLIQVIYSDDDNNGAIFTIADTIVVGVGYFPPEESNQGMSTKMLSFFEKACELAGDRPLLLLGDFNARMGSITGDHMVNGRGRRLSRWLRDGRHGLSIEQPISGRYTCFIHWGGGFGVTELVLSRNIQTVGYRVIENMSLGGSDHRPLVFDIGYQAPAPKRFSRWDIRKLANDDYQKLYRERLANNVLNMHDELADVNCIETIWLSIKSAIENAAELSCGIFEFNRDSTDNTFWTPDLVALMKEVQEEENAWLETIRRHPRMVNMSNIRQELTTKNRQLREALASRRRQLFLEESSQFSNPQLNSAFLRRVKGKKQRLLRSSCSLSKDKIEEYAQHFGSTFGTAPTPFVQEVTSTDDMFAEFVEFDIVEVERILSWSKMGKSSGLDGLFGEFLKYGSCILAPVMTILFNKVIHHATIPQDWKLAKIVPVFKNKGSPADIVNYRPIALTCIVRRLFERLLQKRLHPFSHQLSNFQGGFRNSRSTSHQVSHLLEIIAHHPDSHHVFIDIKTAYDTVNRPRLWHRLSQVYRIPSYLIMTLQALFDDNQSCVAVLGALSSPIINKRGLLQGSALSPTLFNFYIDELLKKLDGLDPELKIRTHGILTNHLHFADDGNIHAKSLNKLKHLLKIVEEWSIEADSILSTTKTEYLGPSRLLGHEHIILYGENIKKTNTFEYLGIPVNQFGVDWKKNLAKRGTKARGVVKLLASVGMNPTGWPLHASITAYMSFVRPVLEFGLNLCVLTPSEISPYQQVQNLALRRIFGAPFNCSVQALHKLANLELMSHRNLILNANYVGAIHNSICYHHPIVPLYRAVLERCNHITSPLKKSIRNNSILPACARIPLLLHPLSQDHESIGPIQAPLVAQKKKKLKLAHLKSLSKGVAKEIVIHQEFKLYDIFTPTATTQKNRITITRWLLGLVAQHQRCLFCVNGDLSRQHAIDCTNVDQPLLINYPLEYDEHSNSNIIDRLLSRYRSGPPDDMFYERIASAIEMIFILCRGMEQKENGFWVDKELLLETAGATRSSGADDTNSRFSPTPYPEPRPLSYFPIRENSDPLRHLSRRISRARRRALGQGNTIQSHFTRQPTTRVSAHPPFEAPDDPPDDDFAGFFRVFYTG